MALLIRPCTKCGKELEVNSKNYTPNKGYKDGFQRICRKCCYKHHKEYRTKEIIYRENHTELAKIRRQKYKKSAKGRIATRRYDKNRDKEKQKVFSRRWIKNNPIKVSEYKRQRRQRLQNVFKNLTYEDWEFILKQFDYRCAYCNKTGQLTLDHVIPISKGGIHTKDNVVPACMSCNSSKNDKDLIDWLNERNT